MIKMFNKWCSALVDVLHDALPLLLVVIFYQMTILQVPVHEVVGMLGWVLFVTFGIVLIL